MIEDWMKGEAPPPGVIHPSDVCLSTDDKNDCMALVAVWTDAALGHGTRSISTWHMDGKTSICAWDGVTCDGGRVTRLDLSSNSLSGTIPSEVGLLTKMTWL